MPEFMKKHVVWKYSGNSEKLFTLVFVNACFYLKMVPNAEVLREGMWAAWIWSPMPKNWEKSSKQPELVANADGLGEGIWAAKYDLQCRRTGRRHLGSLNWSPMLMDLVKASRQLEYGLQCQSIGRRHLNSLNMVPYADGLGEGIWSTWIIIPMCT